jgi:RNA polymerase sigma-70 factor, ECF subfamily
VLHTSHEVKGAMNCGRCARWPLDRRFARSGRAVLGYRSWWSALRLPTVPTFIATISRSRGSAGLGDKTVEMIEEESLEQRVLQAQAGDHQAFAELAERVQSMVYAVAFRRLRNRTEASELTQDVLVQAFRKLRQLREPERFVGWIKRITVRMAINKMVRRPPEQLQDPSTMGHFRAERATPLDAVLRGEQAEQLRGGLNRLRELDRSTLVAFYLEGQSLLEMSDRFRSPVGTIKRRLHTARIRLRDELAGLQKV